MCFTFTQKNGRLQQFGAVAAVLANMQSRRKQVPYDSHIVEELLRILTSAGSSPALPFWILVSALQCCQSVTRGCQLSEALSANDCWLIAQVGVRLLQLCEQRADWDSGFQILYCFHVHGVHYVGQPWPEEEVRGFPAPSSDCAIALTAINICLMGANPAAAIQVQNGCNWIRTEDVRDSQRRSELLIQLLSGCVTNGMLRDACKCVKEITEADYIHCSEEVSYEADKLIQKLLAKERVDMALNVYQSLQQRELHCYPGTFSTLLRKLTERGKSAEANELCQNAVAKGRYAKLAVQDDQFTIQLPVGLTRVEICHLLQDHLHHLGILRSLEEKPLQSLTITFPSGGLCSNIYMKYCGQATI